MAETPSPGKGTSSFFADLPLLTTETAALDVSSYIRAPDDWLMIATDVRDSTHAVAAGQHKTVNFVAACTIAALKNEWAPIPIPFLFGGDGASVMTPGERADETRLLLARLRGFIRRQFDLDLRVGAVTVADIRRAGADVRVGRYEPSPGNHFGVFSGGGVSLLERSIKGKGDARLAALADIPDTLDDRGDLDLSGLSCRWDQLKSSRGKMLSVIVIGSDKTLVEAYEAVQRLAAQGEKAHPVRPETLMLKWPPPGWRLEARAQHKRGPLWLTGARVLVRSLLAHFVITNDLKVGPFDAQKYKADLITNTDFCRYDDGLFFVVDCVPGAVEEIARYLSQRKADGDIRFGLHVADAALMTCLVTSSSESLHVHFVDGANGGYTRAAELLKGRITLTDALNGATAAKAAA